MGGAVDSTLIANPDSTSKEPIDVHFLFNYYEQDGDHSAVTGGEGTQELQNRSGNIIIHVPVDSVTRVKALVGLDYYSSASTDRIDFVMSSASASDFHGYAEITYSKDHNEKRRTISLTGGGSVETDYISGYFGLGWTKWSADKNREFNITGRAYFDTWKLIFPVELRRRGQEFVNTDKRRTFSLSFTYAQVINRRLQGSLSMDLVYQNGLLSTPFHRVYYQDAVGPGIERLPANRVRFPVGARLNYYVNDFLVSRLFGRFYADNFGIVSGTGSIELPVKVTPFISVYPFYRFYAQTASTYFQPFGEHLVTDEFQTSDYDLSAFNSHKIGGGIDIAPPMGIIRNRKKQPLLKSLALRGAYYTRSDGLYFYTLSMDVGFSF